MREAEKEGKMCGVMGDFTVPTTIHKKTWDYPLMPEKALIPEDQLSPKQVELNENNRATQLTPAVPPPDHVGQAPLLCVW